MTSNGLMKIQKTQAAANGDQTIHFLKMIVAPLTQKFRLRIPVEFVKKHGRHLSDDIYLSVPNSEQPWRVQLEKTDSKDMFLGKGWQGLMKFYNMKFGHFLLFRFDGGSQSQFHVVIFDKSATEIDYPSRKVSCAMKRKSHLKNKDVVEVESEEDDISIEILDEFSPKLKQVKTTINLDSSDFDKVECSSYTIKDFFVKQSFQKFKSHNPHFMVIIRSWNLTSLGLTIPLEYARAHLDGMNGQKILLIGPDDEKRYYNLKLYVYLHNCVKVKAEIFGRSGMRKFLRDNELKLGDGCVFELLNPQSNTYKITIFRAP